MDLVLTSCLKSQWDGSENIREIRTPQQTAGLGWEQRHPALELRGSRTRMQCSWFSMRAPGQPVWLPSLSGPGWMSYAGLQAQLRCHWAELSKACIQRMVRVRLSSHENRGS